MANTRTVTRSVPQTHPSLPAIGRKEALARRKDEAKRRKTPSQGDSDLLI
jgi:hypothetical protein